MKKPIVLTLIFGAFVTVSALAAILLNSPITKANAAGNTVTFTFTNDDQVFSLVTEENGKVPLPKSQLEQSYDYDFIYRQNRVLSSWFSDIGLTNEVNLLTHTFNVDTTLYASWLFSNPGSPQFGDVDAFEADITTNGHETSIIPARSEAYITLDVWLAPAEQIISYRWQSRKDDGVDTFKDIVGATTNRLDITQEGKYRYRCFYTYSLDDGLTTYELKSHAITLIRAESNPSYWWLLPVGVALLLSSGLIYFLFLKKYALILHIREDQALKLFVKANTLYEDIHLPTLTKPNEVLVGWSIDIEGKQRFDEPMMPRKDIHLYPIWEKAQKG